MYGNHDFYPTAQACSTDLSVKTGETWLGDLSDDELKELVSLG